MNAYGFDAIQALMLALQMIGAEIYAGHYHGAGLLSFERPGSGYGFPVPASMRDLLVGNDAQQF